jgi:hypothetical protein
LFYAGGAISIMYGVHGYLPSPARSPTAALLWRDALEFAGAEYLPYAARCELEDARGLIDAVEVLFHVGILQD